MGWETTAVDVAVADIFGYNAVQIGLPQIDLLAQNRIPLRLVAGDSGPVDLVCDLRQLPFAAHSVDLVVMAHALEFHTDPHQILREVERVLIAEGTLVICGFNPVSLWGIRRRLPNCPNDFPWCGQYLSLARVKDWLQLLAFEIDSVAFGCYAPPFARERGHRRWQFVESRGQRWWSFAGAVYLVRAVKRVHGMRLITASWKPQKASPKSLAPVSQQQVRAE